VIRLALLTLAAVLALAPAASADSRNVADPRNDPKGSHYPGAGYYWETDGACAQQWTVIATGACGENTYSENQGGRLDIASAGHGHFGRSSLVHRISTHRAWQPSIFRQGGQISFYVTTDGDAAWERRIDLGLRSGKLTAFVRNGRGRLVGRGTATRPNGKSARIVFARRLLGRNVHHTEWLAFAGVACQRKYNLCGDRTPRNSLVVHHLG
jgi:hypothetical protein